MLLLLLRGKIRRANLQVIRVKIRGGKQADCLGCLMRRVEKIKKQDALHKAEGEREKCICLGGERDTGVERGFEDDEWRVARLHRYACVTYLTSAASF